MSKTITTYKVIVIGDSNVGKTSLSYRFCEGKFPQATEVTIGMDFRQRKVDINGDDYMLQLWDTAGLEQNRRSMVAHFYRKAHAVILVYDMTNMKSFNSLSYWIEEIDKYADTNPLRMLVGNKCDEKAEVSTNMAQMFADKNDMVLFETSAKLDSEYDNVEAIFLTLAHKLVNEKEFIPASRTILLSESQENNQGSSRCSCRPSENARELRVDAPPRPSYEGHRIRVKRNNVISIFVSRCRIICLLLLVLIILLYINSLIEYSSVAKHRNYESFKRRDSFKSIQLYTELKKSFSVEGLTTEKAVSNESLLYMQKCEVLHVGFVCSGYKSNLYLHTMLKSLLFYRNNPIHFHILVNKFSENVLKTLFHTWDIPQVNVSFYEMSDYISEVRWVPNSHYSGVYGLLKLVFPKVVPRYVNRMIVLDTDLTFTSNIYELWEVFSEFDYLQAIGLAENESDFYLSKKSTIWPAIGRGFNTGVILYRVDRLRDMSWDKLWMKVSKQAALVFGATSLGDQDIMNTVLKQYPHLVFKVPCYWNTQLSDHTHSHNCYKYNQVKVVHWNSPKKFNVVNKDGDYFRSIYTTFLELNGNLVRSQLYDCSNSTTDSSQSNTDVCSEFKKAKYGRWRTLLYFRNFEYIPVDHDVTFVAQLSYDRLQMVEELSRHWEGPISLTFYVTDPEFQQVIKYVENSEVLQERTNMAYHAVFKSGDYHPINILRNVGLKNVNTPYVFLADIDFLPMFGLYNSLRNTISVLKNMNKKALIVPAFETQRYRSRFPKNKIELLQMLENKSVFTFRYDVWASGHAPTDYTRWKTAKSPYTVKWEPDFEPYIVVKKDVVEYDGRFMGFGWNKVSHIMELECQNYEFIVLHNAFIVHRPHSPSYDIGKFRMSPTYRMCLQNLKEDFVENLKKKYGRVFDNKKVSMNPPAIAVN